MLMALLVAVISRLQPIPYVSKDNDTLTPLHVQPCNGVNVSLSFDT